MNSPLQQLSAGILCACAAGGLALFCTQVNAAEDAGTTVASFLTIPYGARHAAMGGAGVAMPAGLDGFEDNPASAASLTTLMVGCGYRSWIDDTWGSMVATSLPLGKAGVLSAGVVDLDYGTIDETVIAPDGQPAYSGTQWRANSVAGTLQFSRNLVSVLDGGIGVKGIYEYIGTSSSHISSSALAVDAGVQSSFLNRRFILGAAVRNLGIVAGGYSGEANDYPLPSVFEAGVSYVPRLVRALLVTGELNLTRGEPGAAQFGVQVEMVPDIVYVRAGIPVSSSDAAVLFKNIGSTAEDAPVKSSVILFALGGAVHIPLGSASLLCDLGIEFHTIETPAVLITAGLEY